MINTLTTKLKKTHVSEQYVCITCGRTDSPEWRKVIWLHAYWTGSEALYFRDRSAQKPSVMLAGSGGLSKCANMTTQPKSEKGQPFL